MSIKGFLGLAITCLFLAANPANATLQNARLTATISDVGTGSSSFAVGSTVNVDYVFDLSAPLSNSYFFLDSINNITFNGETSIPGGQLFTIGGIAAITTYLPIRADGVDLTSYYLLTPTTYSSVDEILHAFVAANPADTTLRFDIGNNSVFATPTSFRLIPAVPEPSTYLMLLIGLGLIGFMRYKNASVKAK